MENFFANELADRLRPGQDAALKSDCTQYKWTWDILHNKQVPVFHSSTPIPFDMDMEIVDFDNREQFGEYALAEPGTYVRWLGPDVWDGYGVCLRKNQACELLARQNSRSIIILDDFRLYGWIGPEYLADMAVLDEQNYTRH